MSLKDIYPETTPYNSFHLDAWDGHHLRIQESGDPLWIPVIFVHWWPWGRSKASHIQVLDPKKYHIVQFDQRWCWKSTCNDVFKNNTTEEIVDDLERIRIFLWVSKRLVVWNSRWTRISLLYASKYPRAIIKLVSISTWLWTQEWFSYFTNNEILDALYPDLKAKIIEKTWSNISIQSSLKEIVSKDYSVLTQKERWILACMINYEYAAYKYIEEAIEPVTPKSLTLKDYQWMKFLSHFMENESKEEDILNSIVLWLWELECIFVHWRYDTCSPFGKVYSFMKEIENHKILIAEDSGHRLWDKGLWLLVKKIFDALV